MYLCICNAITEKMLEENSFLLHKIGSTCGKCIEGGRVGDNQRVTYLMSILNEHGERFVHPADRGA